MGMVVRPKLDVMADIYADGWYDGAAALRDRFLDIAGAIVDKIGSDKFQQIMAAGIDAKTCNPEVWFASQVLCTAGMFWRDIDKIYDKKKNLSFTKTMLELIDTMIAEGRWGVDENGKRSLR